VFASQAMDRPAPFADPAALRHACREGRFAGPTSGHAHGYVQVNLAILPASDAADFLLFCQRNPKPCPVIAVSEPGARACEALGADLDLARDASGYRLFRNGELAEEGTDASAWWRDDLVTFAIGCSHSFEEALEAEGLTPRHVRLGTTVPMYRTNVECARAGRFHGPLVVSMRPYRPADAIRAIQITARYPAVHGAPVHLADPGAIGIADLARPDYGQSVTVERGEIPVFWACGVTPQAAIARAKPEFAITHAPGRMLVTDLLNARLATG
jgi:uncharacterized protein YcsI (UPF0317 family)